MAFHLQNPKKMVKLFCFLLTVILCYSCFPTRVTLTEKQSNPFHVDFKIKATSKDSTICFEDSLQIDIFFKNITDSIVEFNDFAPFFIIPDYGDGMWIAGEENEQIHIHLNSETKNDLNVLLSPEEDFQCTYFVLINKFFHEGSNSIKFFLHFDNYNPLLSEPIEVMVVNCY